VKVWMAKIQGLADIFTVRQLARTLSLGFLLLSLQTIGWGQSVTLSIASGSGTAGASVSLPINLTSSGGAQAAGLQWSFSYSSDITSVTVVAGPSASNAGKTITCSANSCLVLGFNNTAMSDGTVASATFQISPNPSATSIPIQISGVVASTAAGNSISGSGSSGTVFLPPPTVSVGINPSNATLSASQSRQFSATVTGNANTSVTWSMNPSVGSLSNGLYTAPSVINSPQSVTVTATSVADSSKSASATVQLTPPSVSVGLSPSFATLTASQSTQFTATVTGNANTSVTWSMSPSVGSLSNGSYTAPSVIDTAQSVTVTATSVADPSKSANAMVQLAPAGVVTVNVNPSSGALTASQSTQFTATVTGNANTSVTWSMSPSVGSLSNGSYTAPSVIDTAQSVTVTATSVADPSKSASATVQLTPPGAAGVNVSVSPSSVTLGPSQSAQLTATVTGDSNTSVTWSLSPSIGSLSNGWYTAPSTIKAPQAVTIKATSAADPSKSATATIQLVLVSGSGSSAFAIQSASLPDAQLGQAYSSKLVVVGGTPPFNWSAASVPNGLTVSTDGVITGTPDTAGTFTLTVMVQDSLEAVTGSSVKLRVDDGLVLLSAASLKPGPVAPASMATVFGAQLAPGTQSAAAQPLPTTLGDSTVKIKDANGAERAAGLYYVSPNQITFTIPAETVPGTATITLSSGGQTRTLGNLEIATIAPGLFSLNTDGLAAASLTRVSGNNTSYEEIAQLDSSTDLFVAIPIDLGSDTDQVYLTVYGTGLRLRSSLDDVQVLIGDVPATVVAAGPSGGTDGLDLVTVLLPKELRGKGVASVSLKVGGTTANAVTVVIE
jgi:uncharacterized protein (TIGR03437 family)